MTRFRWLALGALGMYFLDPQRGRRRRNVLRDRVGAVPRRFRRRLVRKAGLVRARAGALAAKAVHLRERRKDWSDETLADKVRSEVFRDPTLPKGAVNLNVEAGRVVLRGEVPQPALVDELERRVRGVVGVREVENLLHAPGADAPEHVARSR
jgi:hypothetical protein